MNVALHPTLAGCAQINALSVCTGGGGLDLGLELAIPGYRPIAYVEREAFACAHLVAAMEQGLLAQAPLWSDARTFPGRQFRGRVDCVVGGIPCQPHSVAGKRKGQEDERDLWLSFRRILIQTGAWCAFIENVPGMVTSGGLERVWRDLHRLGFEVEAGLFSAEEVGASHGRERLFVLAVHQSALTGGGLADRNRERLQGQRADADAQGRENARLQAGLRGRANLVVPSCERRGEGRPEPELHGGRCAAAGDGQPMANSGGDDSEQRYRVDEIRGRTLDPEQAGLGGGKLAHNPRSGSGRLPIQPGRSEQAGADVDGSRNGLVSAKYCGCQGRQPAISRAETVGASGAGQWPLFAPGPGDELWHAVAALDPLRLPALSLHDLFLHACRDAGLDPHGHPGGAGRAAARVHAAQLSEIAQRTLRGVAHGLAGSLDQHLFSASRIDALRMLGNGVVSLAGAHAIRTLGIALARRYGADPARFVWEAA